MVDKLVVTFHVKMPLKDFLSATNNLLKKSNNATSNSNFIIKS